MSADHISIDIETLGTKPGSVVASIGAVVFDPKAGVQSVEELMQNSFKVLLDIRKSIAVGMGVSGDTITWWMAQTEAARKATFYPDNKKDLKAPGDGMQEFINFIKKVDKPYVWGNGANFDITLLEALMDSLDLKYPWSYGRVRCLRTLRAVAPFRYEDMPKNDLPHDSLADAIYQAQNIQLIAEKNPTLTFDR